MLKISKYFQESLLIFNEIHINLKKSCDNNNKLLIKYNNNINKNTFNNKNILKESNLRKEKYKNLFNLIDNTIDEIKILLTKENTNLFNQNYNYHYKNYKTETFKIPEKELSKFIDDISSINLNNNNNNENNKINNKNNKFNNENNNKINNENYNEIEDSTIINNESVEENIIEIPKQMKFNKNKFNTSENNNNNNNNNNNLSTRETYSNIKNNLNSNNNEENNNCKIF